MVSITGKLRFSRFTGDCQVTFSHEWNTCPCYLGMYAVVWDHIAKSALAAPALPRLPAHFRSHSTYEPRLLTIFPKRFQP